MDCLARGGGVRAEQLIEDEKVGLQRGVQDSIFISYCIQYSLL